VSPAAASPQNTPAPPYPPLDDSLLSKLPPADLPGIRWGYGKFQQFLDTKSLDKIKWMAKEFGLTKNASNKSKADLVKLFIEAALSYRRDKQRVVKRKSSAMVSMQRKSASQRGAKRPKSKSGQAATAKAACTSYRMSASY